MHTFCTLFNIRYLARGIALYESLKAHCEAFHLYIYAFDDAALEILRHMGLSDATIVPLTEWEDRRLLDVKPSRSTAEYCWTCTPSVILYSLQNFGLSACTYLDADVYFFGPMQAIFEETAGSSVAVTPHRYTPIYDISAISGRYCIQFVTFKNEKSGLEPLRWWRDACIDWCYARCEDGKFGDQKYLDDWPTRFDGFHPIEHRGAGVAPWNIQQYDLRTNGTLVGIDRHSRSEFDVIFYHFHEMKFYRNGVVDLTSYPISTTCRELIYYPYVDHLRQINFQIRAIDDSIDPNGSRKKQRDLRSIWRFMKRHFNGSYNVCNMYEPRPGRSNAVR